MQHFGRWMGLSNHWAQTQNPACIASAQHHNEQMPGLLDTNPLADEAMNLDHAAEDLAEEGEDEDEEMDVVARAALCFTHSYEAKGQRREEGG